MSRAPAKGCLCSARETYDLHLMLSPRGTERIVIQQCSFLHSLRGLKLLQDGLEVLDVVRREGFPSLLRAQSLLPVLGKPPHTKRCCLFVLKLEGFNPPVEPILHYLGGFILYMGLRGENSLSSTSKRFFLADSSLGSGWGYLGSQLQNCIFLFLFRLENGSIIKVYLGADSRLSSFIKNNDSIINKQLLYSQLFILAAGQYWPNTSIIIARYQLFIKTRQLSSAYLLSNTKLVECFSNQSE